MKQGGEGIIYDLFKQQREIKGAYRGQTRGYYETNMG